MTECVCPRPHLGSSVPAAVVADQDTGTFFLQFASHCRRCLQKLVDSVEPARVIQCYEILIISTMSESVSVCVCVSVCV